MLLMLIDSYCFQVSFDCFFCFQKTSPWPLIQKLRCCCGDHDLGGGDDHDLGGGDDHDRGGVDDLGGGGGGGYNDR